MSRSKIADDDERIDFGDEGMDDGLTAFFGRRDMARGGRLLKRELFSSCDSIGLCHLPRINIAVSTPPKLKVSGAYDELAGSPSGPQPLEKRGGDCTNAKISHIMLKKALDGLKNTPKGTLTLADF